MRKEFEICEKCLKPQLLDNKCDYCGSNKFIYCKKYYSVKQWEYFIDSIKRGVQHDFNPWEFDEETGHINRGSGGLNMIGTVGEPKPSYSGRTKSQQKKRRAGKKGRKDKKKNRKNK